MRPIVFLCLFHLLVYHLSWGMRVRAALPARFVTFRVDAFKLSQLQRGLYLKRVSFKIEPLCELLMGTWAPGLGGWD